MKTLCSLFAAATTLAAGAATFEAVDVDTKIQIGYGLAVADVDGDKAPDILLADKNQIVWYRNKSWEKSVIAEKLTQLDHVCIAAHDLDGDGKAEVAAGAGWNPGDTTGSGAVFYLMPGSNRSENWQPAPLHHEPTVHRMRWVKTGSSKPELVVVPLHGRGNKNGAGDGVKILSYAMPDDPKGEWKTSQIDASLHMTHNFDPVQWDSDPEQELLIGGKEGVFLFDKKGASWSKTQLCSGEGGGAGEVRLGKGKSGKRFVATVEPMHGTNLVVYTEPEGSGLWKRQVVDSTLIDGHALACADLLQTGNDQIVVGWRAMNKQGAKVGIRMFTADESGTKWTPTTIDDNTMACEDLLVADLNGDSRLDIVAAGRATKNVKVYFNRAAR